MTRYRKRPTRRKVVPGMIWCPACEQHKPPSEFTKRANGVIRRHKCITCLAEAHINNWRGELPAVQLHRGPEPMGIAPNCDDLTRHKLAWPYHERQYRR